LATNLFISPALLARMAQIENWIANFSIKGPHVRANRSGQGMSVFVGTAPDETSTNAIVPVVVKITATKGTGGQYDGTVMTGGLTLDGTGIYSLPGSLSAGDSVLVVNDDEYGNSTHWVELNSYAEGVYDGSSSTEGTPRPIIRIQRAKYRTGSPGTLGSSSERVTPDTTHTWDRTATGGSSTNLGDQPVELWVGTGVWYDDSSGTPALTQHMRKLTFAADGRLAAVSAETDYTIDTPDACA
jgi:hypothetical protein